MKTAIKSFEIIKEMYEYFIKKYRDLEPNLMICEKEDFDNVKTALKDYEELKKLKLLPYPKMNDEEYRRSVIKRLQTLEIIKSAGFSLEFDESQNEWFLHITAKGTGVKTYDLLKEVLL